MIIAFDLDGTITTNDTGFEPEYWKKRKPNYHMINLMRLCKKKGHKIIIHTSRLTTEAMIPTIQWLQDNDVPFDAIHFDKPFYDLVIDDKAVDFEALYKRVMI